MNYPSHDQQTKNPIENQAQERLIVENQQLRHDLQLLQADFHKTMEECNHLLQQLQQEQALVYNFIGGNNASYEFLDNNIGIQGLGHLHQDPCFN